MTPLEIVLIGGLFSALLGGGTLYLKLGRSILTRQEHEKECEKARKPLRDDITETKLTCRRIEDKLDESSKNLGNKLHDVLMGIRKMNGDN
jgi:hypothetical protein